MKKIKLSVVIIARNEEKNIEDCLKALQWCDEIVVIDDYSEDKTLSIAKRFGAKAYRRHLVGDFSGQRNFGLKQAKGEWVLFIDADERVLPQLAKEIKDAIKKTNFAGFLLKRRDFLWGKELKHGETTKVKLVRLGKRRAGKWQRKVHETWKIKGRVGELKNPIFHYSHQTISKFLGHVNFYSTLHAKALLDEGAKPSFLRIIINPLAKFFQNWLFRLGFLDKTAGLIVALMMSFHSFLAWSKFYLKRKKGPK